ncbi:MAG: glycosyltransferase family 2 protein [Lachnospiraceae bacterium]|nr:glycosyltransferase family 2 protein [Lachnospiraceae bacterium]MBR1851655.1 glycosyltransferase family 2 protein [Lachnospiraceae bacterium]
MKHTISVIISTYKRKPEVINKAIMSIEQQTYPVSEIIVVDDNSFENNHLSRLSAQIKASLTNRAVYIKQPLGNAGANAARNLGIHNAHGEFVAFLDDDDEWLPEKINKQMQEFDQDKDGKLGLVFCGGIRRELLHKGGYVECDYYNLKEFKECPTHEDMLKHDYIGSTSHPLIRRSVFDKAGMFDEKMPARQDYDMWIRISKYYELKGIRDKLFIHNLHEGEQISKSRAKAYRAYGMLYEKYKDEYNHNLEAWLYIQVAIALNQGGIIGCLRFFAIRAMRKAYYIGKAIVPKNIYKKKE